MKHDHEHKPSPEIVSALGSMSGKAAQTMANAAGIAFDAWTRAQGLHAAVGTIAIFTRIDKRFLSTLDPYELAEEYAEYIRTGEAPRGTTEQAAATAKLERQDK